jgi:hypothetical protein
MPACMMASRDVIRVPHVVFILATGIMTPLDDPDKAEICTLEDSINCNRDFRVWRRY